MTRKKLISQPADWWTAFERQASLEGMPLSEWVGQACLKALPFGDEAEWTVAKALRANGLNPRGKRGGFKPLRFGSGPEVGPDPGQG